MHAPYKDDYVNRIYNQLFCDEPALYDAVDNPWPALFAAKLDERALRKLAEDETAAARIRALAFNRLRAAGKGVPARLMLGVILEVPLDGGLDVLAAYDDLTIRYINQTGRLSIFEAAPDPLARKAQALLSAAQAMIARLGRADAPRAAEPARVGAVRISLLASDGLYVGEGAFGAMERHELAGPLLAAANDLVTAVVDISIRS